MLKCFGFLIFNGNPLTKPFMKNTISFLTLFFVLISSIEKTNLDLLLEISGEIWKANISAETYALVKNNPTFKFEARGHIMAKGREELKMYFVSRTA